MSWRKNPHYTQNAKFEPFSIILATPCVIINSIEIWTGLVCLVPDPTCLALLGWLFRITKWACQGKLAGFHIAAQFKRHVVLEAFFFGHAGSLRLVEIAVDLK
jgi:hypothetical protein